MWPWQSRNTGGAAVAVRKEETIAPPPTGSVHIQDAVWSRQADFIGLTGEMTGWMAGLGAEFDAERVIDRFFQKVHSPET